MEGRHWEQGAAVDISTSTSSRSLPDDHILINGWVVLAGCIGDDGEFFLCLKVVPVDVPVSVPVICPDDDSFEKCWRNLDTYVGGHRKFFFRSKVVPIDVGIAISGVLPDDDSVVDDWFVLV